MRGWSQKIVNTCIEPGRELLDTPLIPGCSDNGNNALFQHVPQICQVHLALGEIRAEHAILRVTGESSHGMLFLGVYCIYKGHTGLGETSIKKVKRDKLQELKLESSKTGGSVTIWNEGGDTYRKKVWHSKRMRAPMGGRACCQLYAATACS